MRQTSVRHKAVALCHAQHRGVIEHQTVKSRAHLLHAVSGQIFQPAQTRAGGKGLSFFNVWIPKTRLLGLCIYGIG